MLCKQNWKNRSFIAMITGHSKENILLQSSVRRQVLLPASYFVPPIRNHCFIKLRKGASIIAYLIIASSLTLVVFGKRQEGFCAFLPAKNSKLDKYPVKVIRYWFSFLRLLDMVLHRMTAWRWEHQI